MNKMFLGVKCIVLIILMVPVVLSTINHGNNWNIAHNAQTGNESFNDNCYYDKLNNFI